MTDIGGAIQRWCLDHPRRTTWIVVELLRPLPIRRRFANAWWQVKNFGDYEAFDALYQTLAREYDRDMRKRA